MIRALMLITLLCVTTSTWSLTTANFAPGNVAAKTKLEGNLVFDFSQATVSTISRASFIPGGPYRLPTVNVHLIADGQDLVPTRRGLTITDNETWDYIVSPGRSWQEEEISVASLPLTLITRSVGCTHNGLIRIEYDDKQILNSRILFGQETCHFFRFDITGKGKTTYTSEKSANADQIRQSWRLEKKDRIPVHSLERLKADHPTFDLDAFTSGLPDDHDLSTFGFYFDGKHYNGGCLTRHGPYPFCGQMLMTSFSTAKTAFASVALMTMAQEFGSGVYESTIADLLPEARQAKGKWDKVTLNQTGDMSSGNFHDPSPLADPAPGLFYDDTDREKKLADAFSWPNARPAGEFFVYQTADTFIQVNAMDAYLKSRQSDIIDSFDYLVDRVLKPLKVQPEVWFSRRTRDNGKINSGTAFGGMGMWWTTDAIVKVARLMLLDGGRINGQQVLNPAALNATMQRDPADRGMVTRIYSNLYNNNTWAIPARVLGEQFSCDPYVVMMQGLSGISIMMMPNGLIHYFFNDARKFPVVNAIFAADKLKPFCGAAS